MHLFWTGALDNRLEAVILGTNQFGMEDLTLTFVAANNGILADIPRQGAVAIPQVKQTGEHAGNIFLRRVRMRWLLYGGHLSIAQANQLFTETARDGGYGAVGFLFAFGGRNIQVSDCDFYSSGNVFNLVEAKGAQITRNRFSIGRCGWANFDGCDGVICEDNSFIGADNMVRSGVTFWSYQLPMRNAYFARNFLNNVYYHDREGMTTDGASGKYFGPVVASGISSVTLPEGVSFKPNEIVGHTCFVLDGAGKGQWRGVIANDERTLTLDRQWDVIPASDSIIGVNHTVAHLLILGNTMEDVGIAFQFYGTAMDSIVAQNRCVRAGGFFSHAARYPGGSKDEKDTQPQFFVQYLDNEVVEGYTPFEIRGYDYGQGHSVIGVQGFSWGGGKLEWKWPLALGFVIRGNKLDSNAKIRVHGVADGDGPPLVEDVVVERNTLSCSRVGIDVGPRCVGIVIRRNSFHEVDLPFAGAGLPGALVEK